jgi:hypothetical protein
MGGKWYQASLSSGRRDLTVARAIAGGGANGGTLVDVLLVNEIREGTLRGAPRT